MEAYKEIHVRTAIDGLHMIFPGKITLIPPIEAPTIYSTDRSKSQKITKGDFVRVKHGLYHDDLGVCYGDLETGQILVKLIPRIDYQLNKLQKNDRPSAKDKLKKKQRPMQKLFNHSAHEGISEVDKDGKKVLLWNNKHFKYGLIYLKF